MFGLVFHAIFLVFSLMWISRCLWRLPGDLLLIREYGRDKNWSECVLEIGIFIFVWGVSVVLFLLFVLPILHIFIKAGTAIFNSL